MCVPRKFNKKQLSVNVDIYLSCDFHAVVNIQETEKKNPILFSMKIFLIKNSEFYMRSIVVLVMESD